MDGGGVLPSACGGGIDGVCGEVVEPMTTRNLSGWIPDAYDPRDLSYSAPAEVAAALPAKTNNRAKFRTPIYEQGAIGSCGPHSCTSDIAFDGDVKGVTLRPSRLFGYYVTRDVMGTVNSDSGVSNREMLKAYARFGWCDESLWPYEPNRFKVKPPPEAYAQAETRKIDQYLRVPQQLDQMKACLAGGDPFIFGFTVFSSMETPEVARTGNVPMPRQGDRRAGGHDVLIVDYSDEDKVFVFRNSWGEKWGDCLAGDTAIQMLDGSSRSIADIYESKNPVWVYSIDETTQRIVPAQATPVFSGFRDDLVRVTLDNGESVTCTLDHKWMRRDGSFVNAAELVAGDSLMPLYRKDDHGYERFYAPNSHKWITTHWMVAHDQDLRDSTGHADGCEKDGCRLVVHHKDFTPRNNEPSNLEMMFECYHNALHARLNGPQKSAQMRERWANDDGTMRANAVAALDAYNEAFRNGDVELTEAQLAARRANQPIATEASRILPRTEKQIAAALRTGKALGKRSKNSVHRQKISESLKLSYANGDLPLTDSQRAARVANIKAAQDATRKAIADGTYTLTEAQRAARRENARKLNERRRLAKLNHKIVSVERCFVSLPTYDLKVARQNCHNFALSAGVFVHNSGYGTIPYEYALHPHLAGDFWTIRWLVVAPPVPIPPPDPLPDTPKVSIHLEYPDGRKWVADGSMRPDGMVSFIQSPAGVLN